MSELKRVAIGILVPVAVLLLATCVSPTATPTPTRDQLPGPLVIPSGVYTSDGYRHSRQLIIEGTTLTMSVKAKVGPVEQFPLLGTHTYRYRLLGGAAPEPAGLDGAWAIELTEVVTGKAYASSFKYVKDFGLVVLGGDSYRK